MQKEFYITAGGQTFTARFENNSSADALRQLLSQGDLTVDMSDYGNFEKVGSLGQSLPTNDQSITTQPGDVILYPVSYTHLDVYKRQPLMPMARAGYQAEAVPTSKLNSGSRPWVIKEINWAIFPELSFMPMMLG